MYTAKERLYRTADNRVVKEGDPASAFLLVAQGGTLSDADAEKYGLNKKAEPETEPETEPDEKAIAAPPANKSIKVKETK